MRTSGILLAVTFAVVCSLPALRTAAAEIGSRAPEAAGQNQSDKIVPVTGSGVHYLASAIIHSTEPTAEGFIQRSTDMVELSGDLRGMVLYHPVSVFDFVNGTLVNTGHQVFSGTVLGSAPVLLLDDEFRFEVDLATGATTGEVHLVQALAGPKVRCHLTITGTGMTPEGNATVAYEGECRFRGR
jgi:hypothetical protein